MVQRFLSAYVGAVWLRAAVVLGLAALILAPVVMASV